MGVPQSSGQIKVREDGSSIFYWHFPHHEQKKLQKHRHSKKKKRHEKEDEAPLLIWLQGGPGSSSLKDAVALNGPYFFGPDGLKKFEYSWSQFSNILFVDNPIGVGYSKNASEDDLDSSIEQLSKDFNTFLQKFFTETELGKKYSSRDFYISGGSYAGKYIPQIAYDYVQSGQKPEISGLAIGNGWVHPRLQYPAYADFALENGLIGIRNYTHIKEKFNKCQKLIDEESWEGASQFCDRTNYELQNMMPADTPLWDIKWTTCEPRCVNFGGIYEFFN